MRWIALLLIPLAMALEVNVFTVPAIISPGDRFDIILSLSGNASNVEIKIPPGLLEERRIEIGDVMGTASYRIPLRLSNDTKPGIYRIQTYISYDENGSYYKEPLIIELKVDTNPYISLSGDIYRGRISTLELHVKWPGKEGTVYVNPSLETPVYSGKLDNVKVKVKAVPICENGLELFRVRIDDYEKNFLILCKDTTSLRVSASANNPVPFSALEVNLRLENSLDIPLTFLLTIRSDLPMEGRKELLVTLDPRGSITLPLKFMVTDEDSAEFSLRTEGDVNSSWRFSFLVRKEPEISIIEREGGVEIVNVGSMDTQNVKIYVNGKLFRVVDVIGVGESVFIPLSGKNIIRVEYGDRFVEREVSIPISLTPWLVFILLLAGLWWWKRARSRSNRDKKP